MLPPFWYDILLIMIIGWRMTTKIPLMHILIYIEIQSTIIISNIGVLLDYGKDVGEGAQCEGLLSHSRQNEVRCSSTLHQHARTKDHRVVGSQELCSFRTIRVLDAVDEWINLWLTLESVAARFHTIVVIKAEWKAYANKCHFKRNKTLWSALTGSRKSDSIKRMPTLLHTCNRRRFRESWKS